MNGRDHSLKSCNSNLYKSAGDGDPTAWLNHAVIMVRPAWCMQCHASVMSSFRCGICRSSPLIEGKQGKLQCSRYSTWRILNPPRAVAKLISFQEQVGWEAGVRKDLLGMYFTSLTSSAGNRDFGQYWGGKLICQEVNPPSDTFSQFGGYIGDLGGCRIWGRVSLCYWRCAAVQRQNKML